MNPVEWLILAALSWCCLIVVTVVQRAVRAERDHVAQIEAARARNDDADGCQQCGRRWAEPGWVDAWIPDDLWIRIAPLPDGRGHLCIHCITAALTELGAQDVPVELWAAPYNRGGPVDERTVT